MMEKIKAKKYEISTVIALLLGIWTVMPAPASKTCALGYYAHCSCARAARALLGNLWSSI